MKNILVSLVFFAIGIAMCIGVIGMWAESSHSITGREEFENIDQAYEFETKISDAAQNIGAKIPSIELSVMSPPTVSYRVKMHQDNWYSPNFDNPVGYGSTYVSQTWYYIEVISLCTFIIILFGGIGLFALLSKDESDTD